MERKVTTTGKDGDGDITSLCGHPWGEVAKLTAIAHIDAETYEYTSGGYQIEVVEDDTVTDGKYLRTKPGGGTANNLDNLPDC